MAPKDVLLIGLGCVLAAAVFYVYNQVENQKTAISKLNTQLSTIISNVENVQTLNSLNTTVTNTSTQLQTLKTSFDSFTKDPIFYSSGTLNAISSTNTSEPPNIVYQSGVLNSNIYEVVYQIGVKSAANIDSTSTISIVIPIVTINNSTTPPSKVFFKGLTGFDGNAVDISNLRCLRTSGTSNSFTLYFTVNGKSLLSTIGLSVLCQK